MKSNVNIVRITSPKYRKGYKWPKLFETAKFYGIRFNESEFHKSSYDVEIMVKIFEEMLKRKYAQKEIYSFLFE